MAVQRGGAETVCCVSGAHKNFPELEQPDWLEKLHFMVDMTAHLNTLHKSLQGKGGTALQMLEEVLAFERKMTVFARDVQSGMLSHFSSLSSKKHTIR